LIYQALLLLSAAAASTLSTGTLASIFCFTSVHIIYRPRRDFILPRRPLLFFLPLPEEVTAGVFFALGVKEAARGFDFVFTDTAS